MHAGKKRLMSAWNTEQIAPEYLQGRLVFNAAEFSDLTYESRFAFRLIANLIMFSKVP